MQLDSAKNAYTLGSMKNVINDRLYVFDEGDKTYIYKQMVRENGLGMQRIMDKNCDHRRLIAGEVVNSKLAKYFDIDCPEYKVGVDITRTLGVFSENQKDKHKNVRTLAEYLIEKNAFGMQKSSLEELKKSKCKKSLIPIFNKLDNIALFHCATGQRDGHFGNILVYNKTGCEYLPLTACSIIDNGYTYPAIKSDIYEIKKMYMEDHNKVLVLFGITEDDFENAPSLKRFYNDIKYSPYISSKAIQKHLDNAYNAIDNGILIQIKDEIIDEYKIVAGSVVGETIKTYIEGAEVVLNHTTKDIEKAYMERE